MNKKHLAAWFAFSVCMLLAAQVSAAASPPPLRTYTNADFYKNGAFQPETAKDAIAALLESFGERLTPAMRSKLWVSDFGLGDFEHVGLSSITWINRLDYGYYAMTMYLLPNQMLPEHRHMPITAPPPRPAKHESWRMLHGWAYNFSSVGPMSLGLPAIPKSFGPIKSIHVDMQQTGEVLSLRQLESWHFMKAGPAGAIIDEYGNFQDRRGWQSSNPSIHIGN